MQSGLGQGHNNSPGLVRPTEEWPFDHGTDKHFWPGWWFVLPVEKHCGPFLYHAKKWWKIKYIVMCQTTNQYTELTDPEIIIIIIIIITISWITWCISSGFWERLSCFSAEASMIAFRVAPSQSHRHILHISQFTGFVLEFGQLAKWIQLDILKIWKVSSTRLGTDRSISHRLTRTLQLSCGSKTLVLWKAFKALGTCKVVT